jgi:hypothetical protein
VARAGNPRTSRIRAEPTSQGFGITKMSRAWRARNAFPLRSCLAAEDTENDLPTLPSGRAALEHVRASAKPEYQSTAGRSWRPSIRRANPASWSPIGSTTKYEAWMQRSPVSRAFAYVRTTQDCHQSMSGAIGGNQLDSLGEAESPGPAPRRDAGHPKPRTEHVPERIGHIPVERNDPAPEIPDERPAVRAQDPADLGQAGSRVGPVVHRQRADDQVERSVREPQGSYIADEEEGRRSSPDPGTLRVGSGALDHCRIEVDSGHVQAVPARQQDRQVARSASHFEDPCAARGDGRNVLGDLPEERAEQDAVAQRVVTGGIPDEDPTRDLSFPGGTADVPVYGVGRGGSRGRSEQYRVPATPAITDHIPA